MRRVRPGLGPHLQRPRAGRPHLPADRRPRPLFTPAVADRVVAAVLTTEPEAHALPGSGWTLAKLRQWVGNALGRVVSRSALHRVLRAARLSWKKCKKLLGRRKPEKRRAFLEHLARLYDQVRRDEVVLVYVDESHSHRDLDLGYTWGRVGERVWRVSDCPPLADRINWYGASNFTDGRCLLWADGACNKEATAAFLGRLAGWLPKDGRRVVVVWDGVPWHRAAVVQQAARGPGIELVPPPGYSPDLNPLEGLWKWMREEATQLCGHPTLAALAEACQACIATIHESPLDLVARPWPRFERDPEVEKRGFSK